MNWSSLTLQSLNIEFFMVTHNAIPSGPGGVPVWMINASIMESLDCSNQNTEPKMFGSAKKAYGDFCCVPRCSNQRGNDKINGWKRSYYRFPKPRIPNKPAFGWKWSVGIIGSRKITIGFVLTILKEVYQFLNINW